MTTTATTIILTRRFFLDKGPYEEKLPLPDPGRHMTAQQVCNFHSALHPELTTATIRGAELTDGYETYYFSPSLGTKG